MPADLAAAAQLLSHSEDFVVLRRLTRVDEYHPPDDEPKRIALFVDVAHIRTLRNVVFGDQRTQRVLVG